MKNFSLFLLALLIFNSYLLFAAQSNGFELNFLNFKGEKVRTGIKRSLLSPAKANLIYYPGFADSMMNHGPLFSYLNAEGYNIIAFDYLGHGGSEGHANQMRIDIINEMGQMVWNYYSKSTSKKMNIIAWSTGGLAAYKLAYKKPQIVKSLALIAPGIPTKIIVGKNFVVTEKTLTRRKFKNSKSPFLDPIRPKSPLLSPLFAADITLNSFNSKGWKLNKNVRGHAFLSSSKDKYVDTLASEMVLRRNASHFFITDFYEEKAYHALDNELPEVSGRLRVEMADFFHSL